MGLAESIHTKFLATASITALIGADAAARVYPVIAPENTLAPYVAWQEIASTPDATLAEASASSIRLVQFSCVAGTYKAARDLAAAIVAALDNVTLAGSEVCLRCTEQDGYSEATDQFLRIVEAEFFGAPG